MAIGIFDSAWRWRIFRRGANSQGIVVGESVKVLDGHQYVATVFQFTTATGATFRSTYYPLTARALPPGTPLPVRYLQDRPQQCVVHTARGYLAGPLCLLGLSAASFAIAIRA